MIRRALVIAVLTLAAGVAGLPFPESGPAASAAQEPARRWIRSPSYSSEGRLAFEVDGDIWASGVRRGRADLRSDELVQVTAGIDWDRDPAWSADGHSIVFASDRGGSTVGGGRGHPRARQPGRRHSPVGG